MRFPRPCRSPIVLCCTACAAVLAAGGCRDRGRGDEERTALPAGVGQLIVGVAPDWDSPRGRLQCFERNPETGDWRAVSKAVPVLYGAAGLAWGRGVLHAGGAGGAGGHETGPRKQEGDGRAPAGVFALGKIYTYDASLPVGADYPLHQVTAADAWIDDPSHPQYNRHVTVDPSNPPAWFDSQRMRLGDPAYRWMIEIRHNADPPVPGAGSAIFLHVRRGPDRATAGCTVMAEDDLVRIIRWLRAERHPHFVLLPWSEYQRRQRAWGLPGDTASLRTASDESAPPPQP